MLGELNLGCGRADDAFISAAPEGKHTPQFPPHLTSIECKGFYLLSSEVSSVPEGTSELYTFGECWEDYMLGLVILTFMSTKATLQTVTTQATPAQPSPTAIMSDFPRSS